MPHRQDRPPAQPASDTITTRQHETMTDDDRPAETDRTTTARTAAEPTLGDISHVNPYTNRTFGTTRTYGRGRLIAADGGEPEAADEDDTLEDVDHTPADDVDGAQGTFDRGKAAPDDEPDDE
jgi:hypothetical protein